MKMAVSCLARTATKCLLSEMLFVRERNFSLPTESMALLLSNALPSKTLHVAIWMKHLTSTIAFLFNAMSSTLLHRTQPSHAHFYVIQQRLMLMILLLAETRLSVRMARTTEVLTIPNSFSVPLHSVVIQKTASKL